MKRLAVVALLAAGVPLAWAPTPAGASTVQHQRRYCTSVNLRAGSRMAQRRVCLTADQWRRRSAPPGGSS
jgi:hypothetical protein